MSCWFVIIWWLPLDPGRETLQKPGTETLQQPGRETLPNKMYFSDIAKLSLPAQRLSSSFVTSCPAIDVTILLQQFDVVTILLHRIGCNYYNAFAKKPKLCLRFVDLSFRDPNGSHQCTGHCLFLIISQIYETCISLIMLACYNLAGTRVFLAESVLNNNRTCQNTTRKGLHIALNRYFHI